MKNLKSIIQEKLRLCKDTKVEKTYNYHPKTREELRKILEERLEKDKNANLNDIDVSNITDMGTTNFIGLFEDLDPHNIDISEWNVSKVTNMRGMFYSCTHFNSDLNNWNVSNVTNMVHMFNNSPLENNPPKWYKP